jgi:hypothetical protein
MATPSIVNDNASNGQAVEHNPQSTQESELQETKSISINPRAIGTIGPNFNESVGQTFTQIPQPTQFLSL